MLGVLKTNQSRSVRLSLIVDFNTTIASYLNDYQPDTLYYLPTITKIRFIATTYKFKPQFIRLITEPRPDITYSPLLTKFAKQICFQSHYLEQFLHYFSNALVVAISTSLLLSQSKKETKFLHFQLMFVAFSRCCDSS